MKLISREILSLIPFLASLMVTSGCKSSARIDGGAPTNTSRPPARSTVPLANWISYDEAARKARHATDEVIAGWVVTDGIRREGAWEFMAYSPVEHVADGHFFVLVFDDGTVELKGAP